MKKRLLSGLLVLVMLLAMLPVGVLAEEVELFGEDPVDTDHEHIDKTGPDGVPNGVCDENGCHVQIMIPHDEHIDEDKNGTCDVVLCTEHVCFEGELKDGYCAFNNCTATQKCMHEAGVNDLCTEDNCNHESCEGCGGPGNTEPGGTDLPSYDEDKPQLDLPEEPGSLTGLGLSVVVDCGHPDHDTPVYYEVIDGTWEDKVHVYFIETSDEENPYDYYCSIRVDEDVYISKFDVDAKGIHTNATKNIPSFTLKYVDDQWTVVEKGTDDILRIQVECVPDTPAVTLYTIYASSGKHGRVTSDGRHTYVEAGDDVTFWFYPDKGYEVSAVWVDGLLVNYYGLCYDHYWDCDGCDECWWIDWSQWYDCDHHWHDHHDCWYGHGWTDWQDGITFYDVDDDHDLYVEFAPIDSGCASAYYYDLNTEAWYHEATDFVIENDIMKGVGGKYFDPNGTTTRGQLVTMLYRLAGEPKVSGESEFLDVPDDMWYTDAVIWATKKGIVEGYGNGYFGVNDIVTREQTVTILYRYAKYMGISVSKLSDLKYFLDNEDVSDYAEEPFGWAVKRDVIEGKTVSGGYLKLDPQGATARVEMAAMVMRFAKYVD